MILPASLALESRFYSFHYWHTACMLRPQIDTLIFIYDIHYLFCKSIICCYTPFIIDSCKFDCVSKLHFSEFQIIPLFYIKIISFILLLGFVQFLRSIDYFHCCCLCMPNRINAKYFFNMVSPLCSC